MSPRDDYYTHTEEEAGRFEAAHVEDDDRPSLADCAPQDFIDEAAVARKWLIAKGYLDE